MFTLATAFGSLLACRFHLFEGPAVIGQRGLLTSYLLPPAHNDVDIPGIDVDPVADTL
jgi:hypothetical protein